MGHWPLFDCRYPSLPRLLAIPARHRRGPRHLSSARGAPRSDACETGRTGSARGREEFRIARPDLSPVTIKRHSSWRLRPTRPMVPATGAFLAIERLAIAGSTLASADFAGSAGVILIVEQPCCIAAAKGRHLSCCRPATTNWRFPMVKQTKGRIRHVALSVQDPWETAEFYKEALGLEEVTELDGALAEGVFLTDGVVNLALLKFKTDAASQGTGKDFVGIHHIGFWVDDVVEQGKIVRNTGAEWIMGDPNNPDGYEVKHTDLSGIIFDIAAHGWAGSQKDPGQPGNVVHANPQRRLAKFDERRAAARANIEARKAKQAAAE